MSAGATLRPVTAAAEIRRLRYLQAMGIGVCVARRELPWLHALGWLEQDGGDDG